MMHIYILAFVLFTACRFNDEIIEIMKEPDLRATRTKDTAEKVDRTDFSLEWQAFDAQRFVFRAPPDLVRVRVQAIDSMVARYESADLVIASDFGRFSAAPAPGETTTVTIDGHIATQVVYDTPADERPFAASIHFTELGSDRLGKLTVTASAKTAAARELALAVFKSIVFAIDSEEVCTSERYERVLIDHYRVPCQAEARGSCGIANGQLAYDSIEGFAWTARHRYDLIVHVEPTLEPKADGSCVQRTLQEILAETVMRSGTRFSFPVEREDVMIGAGANMLVIAGQAVRCDNEQVCTQALAIVDTSEFYQEVVLGYEDDATVLYAINARAVHE